jgi:hypothetical protein
MVKLKVEGNPVQDAVIQGSCYNDAGHSRSERHTPFFGFDEGG